MNSEIKIKSLHITPFGDIFRLQCYKDNSVLRAEFPTKEQAFKYAVPLAKKDNAVIVIHGNKIVEHVYKF